MKSWQLQVTQQVGKMLVRICSSGFSPQKLTCPEINRKWSVDFIPQSGDFTLTNPDLENAKFWCEWVLEMCSLSNRSSFIVLIIIMFPNYVLFWAASWYFPPNAACRKVLDWNTATKMLGSRRLCWLDIAGSLYNQEHFAVLVVLKPSLFSSWKSQSQQTSWWILIYHGNQQQFWWLLPNLHAYQQTELDVFSKDDLPSDGPLYTCL